VGSYVLTICLFNFIAGFVAAMYMHSPRSLRIPRRRQPRELSDVAVDSAAADSETMDENIPEWTLNSDWQELLSGAGIASDPTVSTVLHGLLLWLELAYQPLLDCDANIRQGGNDAKKTAAESDVKRIEEICGELGKRLTEASTLLQSLPLEPADQTLDDRVYDLRMQVEGAMDRIPAASENADHESLSVERCIAHLVELAHDCNLFRDDLVTRLAASLADSEQATSEQSDWVTDPLTERGNRVGFELAVKALANSSAGPHRVCALHIDRFDQIHHLVGPRHCNQLLTELGAILIDLVPNRKESLSVSRLHDVTFAICLADTDQNTAETVTERLRQAVEAISFAIEDQIVDITISCAIVECREDENSSDLLKRSADVLNMVVDAGGNHTGTDDEGAAALIEPRAFQVESRRIELGTESRDPESETAA